MFNPDGVGSREYIIGPSLTDEQIVELIEAFPELEQRFLPMMKSPLFNLSIGDVLGDDNLSIDHPDFIYGLIDRAERLHHCLT